MDVEDKLSFFVPTEYSYIENGYLRNYKLTFCQKIFVTLSHEKSCLLAKIIRWIEKLLIILNLVVYVVSWQKSLLKEVHNCPEPVCSKKVYCQEYDVCPPVVAPEFLMIHIICTSFFGLFFLLQALTSMSVPARIAEVLYPVPDEYFIEDNQQATARSNSLSSPSISQDGKPRRRASLIADRITKTENGKSNWNVSFILYSHCHCLHSPHKQSIHELQSTISVDPIYRWYITLSRYLLKPRSLVQIVTTIPMIITFIFCFNYYQPDLWYINISRIVQLAELFKLQSYQRAVKVISNTVLQTYKTFFFLYWFMMLLVMIFVEVVFALERGEFTVNETYPDGAYLRWNVDRTEKEVSPFLSLSSSMWYALVSMTTVGYGDVVPTSVAGRAVGAFLLLISFIVISLPITVLGEAFATAVDHYNIQKLKLRSKSNENILSPLQTKIEDMFRESVSSEENFNPVRRSYIQRLSRIASTRYFLQGNDQQQQQSKETQQEGEESEQQQQQQLQSEAELYNQTMNKYLDRINNGSTNEKMKERAEIEMELFRNNKKMKEIEMEYHKQMKQCFELQSNLFIRLQEVTDCLETSSLSSTSAPMNDNPNPLNQNYVETKSPVVSKTRRAFEIAEE